MTTISSRPWFNLGRIRLSDGVNDRLKSRSVMQYLERHQSGDWGDMDPEGEVFLDECVPEPKFGTYLLSEFQDEETDETVMVYTSGKRTHTVVFFKKEMTVSFLVRFALEILMVRYFPKYRFSKNR